MELYLVQHGLAKSPEEDPERSLTDEGKHQTKSMRPLMKNRNIAEVWYSGKRRALQTVEILTEGWETPASIRVVEDLNPNDDPALILNQLASSKGNLMIVGHKPHLPKLVGKLLVGDENQPIVEIINSGVLCLSGQDKEWNILWYRLPEIF